MAYTSLEVLPLRSASGPVVGTGDQVRVYYEGRLTDGTLFDRNYDFATFTPVAGRTPFSFILGSGQVIQGWEQGVVGLSLGDIAELRIPSALGYGPAGSPPRIPANADLNFKVMVVGRVQAGLNPADPANLQSVSYNDLGLSMPTAAAITAIAGQSPAAGLVSKDATPELVISAPAGTTVSVQRDGAEVGTATEDPKTPGRFLFTSPALADGSSSFTARASIVDGLTIAPLSPLIGPISAPVALSTDTLAPVVTVDAVGGNRIIGDEPDDDLVTGQGEPLLPVQILVDGTPVGMASADATGAFSFRFGSALEGLPTKAVLQATQTDAAGNEGSSSAIPFSTDAAVQPDPLIDGGPVDATGFKGVRSASRVREGDPLVNSFQTDLEPRTTVFWQIEGAGVRADDFGRGDLSGHIRVDQKGLVTVRHQLAMNGPANENESFRIRFFSDEALSQPLGSTGLIAIRDAEPAFYGYAGAGQDGLMRLLEPPAANGGPF